MSGYLYSLTFYVYIAARVWLANRVPIMDCDEVFNYWEQLHFFIYRIGFLTWEYSYQFALRTHAYISPLNRIAMVVQYLLPDIPRSIWPYLADFTVYGESWDETIGDNKVAFFIIIRSFMALTVAYTEIKCCQAIAEYVCAGDDKRRSTNVAIGVVAGALMLTSAGMGHAAGAFLPSATIMLLWLMNARMFLKNSDGAYIFFFSLAAVGVGWPFGAVVFVPMALSIWQRRRNTRLFDLVRSGLCLTIVYTVMVMEDFERYHEWVFPIFNIIKYNIQQGGDELYGVEPLEYYVKNLLLNFNYVAILGVLSLPFFLIGKRNRFLAILVAPLYIWLALLGPRPHKEERFLYPIYPCLCIGAAGLSVLAVEGVHSVVFGKNAAPLSLPKSLFVQTIIWLPAMLISAARLMALNKYYMAPILLYSQLQQTPEVQYSVVCTCGEWYRFPSHFFIPETVQKFGLVQSSFDGQLPQLSTVHGSSKQSPLQFNDQNKPEANSLTDIEECDFLIDLLSAGDCRDNDSLWEPIAQVPFLDADRTSLLHRTLYLPGLHEEELHKKVEEGREIFYDDYVLFQRKRVAEPEPESEPEPEPPVEEEPAPVEEQVVAEETQEEASPEPVEETPEPVEEAAAAAAAEEETAAEL
eukprot:Nitzschia sp. Nitz4//scaffold291_size36643//2695//4605//NITZ4_007758-RA/size36643-processed-gene-0.24-mRNA-1//-1//CDS//3329546112//889//frame0